MSESGASEDVYAPPASDLGADARRSSPRLRFWLACLWSLIFAPVIFYELIAIQAPMSLFPIVALAAWLAPLSWVLSAHLPFSTGGAGLIRMIIVAVGLSRPAHRASPSRTASFPLIADGRNELKREAH